MRIAVVILSLVLLACGGKKEEQASQDIPPQEDYMMIYYERTPCFGTCPHFEFKAFASGKCNYEGKRFVEMEGHFTATAKAKDLQAIMAVADEIGFYDLDARYDNKMVMDLPSVKVELTKDGNTKSVLNRYKGPEELDQLYKELDDLIAGLDWKSIE
jgi:hypothetical protein